MDLLTLIKEKAKADKSSKWFPVVASDQVQFVEEELGVSFPDLLRSIYLKVSNGGLGPGYKLGGLPGGNECAWGDIVKSTVELRIHADTEEGWVPIIDWGCNQVTVVDCDDNGQIITWLEGDVCYEDYDFNELMLRWVNGEQPDIHSGGFVAC